MLKGQSPKLKGSICNISIYEINASCMTLPKPAGNNVLVAFKLKPKVEYCSLELFEPVRPSFVESF